MREPSDRERVRVRDQVMAALEAGCGALRAMEVASTLGGGCARRQGHIKRAIELLRQALSEMRWSEREDSDVLDGFVLAKQPRSQRDDPPTNHL